MKDKEFPDANSYLLISRYMYEMYRIRFKIMFANWSQTR